MGRPARRADDVGMSKTDLYDRISGLRGDALDVLDVIARTDAASHLDDVGLLVTTIQRITNQLGSAQALLAPAAPPR